MTVLNDLSAALAEARHWLSGLQPDLAIILGSGYASALPSFNIQVSCPYRALSGFPDAGVAGHQGFLHSGDLAGRSLLVFQGRYHFYEGYSAWQVSAPVRLAAGLGCRKILLTNAAGGISERLSPGDFMLVTDHINLTGQNPLIGRPEGQFIDLSNLYANSFFAELQIRLQQKGIVLREGVLAWLTGPSYETPAEIRALEVLGCDAVSMSTIPEAIVARSLGLEVAACSFISNKAAGKSREVLSHEDVLAVAGRASASMPPLFEELLLLWN